MLYFRAGVWRIGRLSPKVEKYLAKDGCDRPIDEIFPEAAPRLSELADEVAVGGADLKDVRVSLKGKIRGAAMVAEVRPRPGAVEESPLRIEFFFRELAPSEALAPRFFHGMVGVAPAVLELFRKIELYGASDASVVVTGETGTGKELVA
ncbi:MAG: sigma 54-interacting transcriptional regulator, partial [Deltaproteobacteria bacterium]|nr:sigma 54-interacting transcriptional regulator [Deltaproteobacteria bacterium]